MTVMKMLLIMLLRHSKIEVMTMLLIRLKIIMWFVENEVVNSNGDDHVNEENNEADNSNSDQIIDYCFD